MELIPQRKEREERERWRARERGGEREKKRERLTVLKERGIILRTR